MLTNLLADIPAALPAELTDTLVQTPGLRIEGIVSRGQASPPGFWYDQAEDEWILVVRGAARLRIQSSAGEEQTIELRPGDFRLLPAHQLHRVEWTAPDEATVWLAVFFVTP